jgi:hypothetical protein
MICQKLNLLVENTQFNTIYTEYWGITMEYKSKAPGMTIYMK